MDHLLGKESKPVFERHAACLPNSIFHLLDTVQLHTAWYSLVLKVKCQPLDPALSLASHVTWDKMFHLFQGITFLIYVMGLGVLILHGIVPYHLILPILKTLPVS